MPIKFNEGQNVFKLDTPSTSYLIGIVDGYLGHIYYGKRLSHDDCAYLLRTDQPPFSPSVNKREKCSFLSCFPAEFPTGGIGDFRESCLNIRNSFGQTGAELLYQSHKITQGKPPISGLPSSFGADEDGEDVEEVDTLEITCFDNVLQIAVVLSYSVFRNVDVVTRSARIENQGAETLYIDKAYSACLDMENEDFEMISLYGSWARERHIQRAKLHYGRQNMSSLRGETSHQEHPFIALVGQNTTQDCGDVYAMHFVYSGNFLAQAELTSDDTVRMTMGINPEGFCWQLSPKDSFQTPETVLVYSSAGLGKMTQTFHDFYRQHLIRDIKKPRPILINNWEATYFDFDEEKLLSIAKEAKECGIEMLVMDDGWFGNRNSDDSSLGDWTVNSAKLPSGLPNLVDKVRALGMEFGIWFEPEMISPNSNLYKSHPDWAIQIQKREPCECRAQYVLDITRDEVADYVYESVANVLRSADITYVKWDMNRPLCDIGNAILPPERQGEIPHRYVLAVYKLQERLLQEFPYLLLENCSGGGARFDPAMLYYSPQIWCSDDTDAVERLLIQEGTSLIYPLSCIGAHVSACPNHTVGRVTPFSTRANVAMTGTFGYELDINRLTDDEKAQVKGQIDFFKKYRPLIFDGDYHRILSYAQNHFDDCWAVVSKDKEIAMVTYVQVLARPNRRPRRIKLSGLDKNAMYRLLDTNRLYSGDTLMNAGFILEGLSGDFQNQVLIFKKST